ncbi:MAG: hypothetical protein RL497_1084, partial [Pseudomonadota bacterium]
MNFMRLDNFSLLPIAYHWLKRWQGRAPQAALATTTHETSGPLPPELTPTPQDWLDKQPPENAILVYISMPSHQIVELR